MHFYRFYGLSIGSEIEFPEAAGSEVEAADRADSDVLILMGAVPPELPEFQTMAGTLEVGRNSVLVQAPRVVRLLVEAGHRITVDPAPGALISHVRFHLLSTALVVLLIQRGNLLLHGSAVSMGDHAVGFLGDGGMGKSTLAAQLGLMGCPIVSDDLLVFTEEDGDIWVSPGPPFLKLWPDSASELLLDNVANVGTRASVKLRANAPTLFARARLPLKKLFVLQWLAFSDSEVESVEVNGLGAVPTVVGHLMQRELISALKHEAKVLMAAAALCQNIDIGCLRRPMNFSNVFLDFI